VSSDRRATHRHPVTTRFLGSCAVREVAYPMDIPYGEARDTSSANETFSS
jgi:hypothetical protein